MRGLFLLKLGGSLLTDKGKMKKVRLNVIKRLSGEIAQAVRENSGLRVILGNGQGAFAHRPAKKYGTLEGYRTQEQKLGFCRVQSEATIVNRILVDELLRKQVPAIGVSPNSIFLTENKRLTTAYLTNILRMLEEGIVPVVYGDALLDRGIGSTIFSCDRVLLEIARRLVRREVKVSGFFSVGNYPGVYADGRIVVEQIDYRQYRRLLEMKKIKGSSKVDVTGGMRAKLEDMFEAARLGIKSAVVDGRKKGNLYNALTGKVFAGTRIVA